MAAVWTLAGAAVFVKLLLIPSYRSTDFEVHRNWLAITHNLPVRQWYTDETSQWTLDYPPLFAWFECFLSYIATQFDSKMLEVSNLNYASESTVLFQRLSVIFTDFVYYFAVYEFQNCGHLIKRDGKKNSPFNLAVVPILLIFNIGLFIVDHIHFQYNGILFGIMLLSITRILQDKPEHSAFWFAVLLNMKHIFVYIAPAYFIYLLRTFCFQENKPISLSRIDFKKLANLASVVAGVFVLSFGPFIYFQQVGQVLSRLFPFKRGLVHAYWAPNFWALYSGVDKVLTVAGVKLGLLNSSQVPAGSMTAGLVQEYSHVALPSIPAGFSLIVVLFGIMPALLNLWHQRTKVSFVRTVIICALTSYMFGWHVHEKAILMAIIPMTLMVMYSKQDAKLYLILATTGFYSLFPLLFTPFENILKVLLLAISCIFSFKALDNVYGSPKKSVSFTKSEIQLKSLMLLQLPLLNLTESIYIWGLLALGLFNSIGFWMFGIEKRYPFLPLLLTSVYCSLGVLYCWLEFYRLTLTEGLTRVYKYLGIASDESLYPDKYGKMTNKRKD
ncbi:probable dolichyl pyrophosphate Glc1Man9GlcNAc2 alpha-1,3-glucosyltransferase [Physella acuta]|uniref:probable dolichyl pyrophosphate Glc1Man9GlcNAc2 alpha-1,3-glucosyltransferase n=1 Tax=Physella acuta TaxID=109671 RepID=UPI0027DC8A57|nr:probable dolichyl pyrophosphate Glc1Man9GlcNAc2 alpha-1,3-glucosyltransferase [Physella acuta]